METIRTTRRLFVFPLLAAIGIAIPAMAAMVQPSNHPDVDVRAAQDTAAIEAALNEAAASGPGAVVELAEGTFYVSRPIAVRDFDGTFKGQGMGSTTVRTIGDNAFPLNTPPLPPMPNMFSFYYRDRAADASLPANLAVSGMTLHFSGFATPFTLGSPFSRFRNGLAITVFGRMSSAPVSGDPARVGPDAAPAYLHTQLTGLEMKSDVRDMGFCGAMIVSWLSWAIVSDPVYGPYTSLATTQPTHGSVSAGRLSFRNMRTGIDVNSYEHSPISFDQLQAGVGRTVIQVDNLFGGQVRASGIDAQDVRVGLQAYFPNGTAITLADSRIGFGTHPIQVGAIVTRPTNADVTLTGLDLANGAALEFEEVHSPAPSTYHVFDNRVLRGPNSYWGAIEAHGLRTANPGDASPRVFVEHNTIRSQGQRDAFAPVFSEGIDQLIVSNNTISGPSGPLAVIPAAFVVRNGDACRLVNNDVREFETTGAKYYLENVDDCLIAAGASAGGVSEDEVVINGGNNNRIVGVRPTGFTGPAIDWTAMSQAKRSMLQSMNDD